MDLHLFYNLLNLSKKYDQFECKESRKGHLKPHGQIDAIDAEEKNKKQDDV